MRSLRWPSDTDSASEGVNSQLVDHESQAPVLVLNELENELTHDLLVINIIPGLFLKIDLHLNVDVLDKCSKAHRFVLRNSHQLFRVIEIVVGLSL